MPLLAFAAMGECGSSIGILFAVGGIYLRDGFDISKRFRNFCFLCTNTEAAKLRTCTAWSGFFLFSFLGDKNLGAGFFRISSLPSRKFAALAVEISVKGVRIGGTRIALRAVRDFMSFLQEAKSGVKL